MLMQPKKYEEIIAGDHHSNTIEYCLSADIVKSLSILLLSITSVSLSAQ